MQCATRNFFFCYILSPLFRSWNLWYLFDNLKKCSKWADCIELCANLISHSYEPNLFIFLALLRVSWRAIKQFEEHSKCLSMHHLVLSHLSRPLKLTLLHTVYLHPCIVCLLLERMYNPESLIFFKSEEEPVRRYALYKGDLDVHVPPTNLTSNVCWGMMKMICRLTRSPHLPKIDVHGEIL